MDGWSGLLAFLESASVAQRIFILSQCFSLAVFPFLSPILLVVVLVIRRYNVIYIKIYNIIIKNTIYYYILIIIIILYKIPYLLPI
jgi:hypothetical protein